MSQIYSSKYYLNKIALIPYSQQLIRLYCVILQSFTITTVITVKANKTMIKKIVTQNSIKTIVRTCNITTKPNKGIQNHYLNLFSHVSLIYQRLILFFPCSFAKYKNALVNHIHTWNVCLLSCLIIGIALLQYQHGFALSKPTLYSRFMDCKAGKHRNSSLCLRSQTSWMKLLY